MDLKLPLTLTLRTRSVFRGREVVYSEEDGPLGEKERERCSVGIGVATIIELEDKVSFREGALILS